MDSFLVDTEHNSKSRQTDEGVMKKLWKKLDFYKDEITLDNGLHFGKRQSIGNILYSQKLV